MTDQLSSILYEPHVGGGVDLEDLRDPFHFLGQPVEQGRDLFAAITVLRPEIHQNRQIVFKNLGLEVGFGEFVGYAGTMGKNTNESSHTLPGIPSGMRMAGGGWSN
jgi:hypothetical protein